MEYISFYNGIKIPALGYGVCDIGEDICKQCVLNALSIGYRSFDTAQSYNNEQCLGDAFSEYGINRKDLFITTKVRPHYYSNGTYQSVMESMKKLRTDYIDLVLLHQPFGDVYAAWRELEKLYEEGKVRAIGVSNFYEDRLVDLAYFAKIRPMADQVERHPLHQRPGIKEWADKLNISLIGWAPFGRGKVGLFENPVLNEIAKKYDKTVAQIILRWNYQCGFISIPKSTDFERMTENFKIFDFEIKIQDMERIAGIETGESVFYSHNDPQIVENYAKTILNNNKQEMLRA